MEIIFILGTHLATVLVRVLQGNTTNRIYLFTKRFIIRNWLVWLLRLTSPKICRIGWQAGDPESHCYKFQSEYKDLRTDRINGVVLVWRPAGKMQEKQMLQFESKDRKKPLPGLKVIRQQEFSLTWGKANLFVLARPSTDWMWPTNIRESNLLYSIYLHKC